MERRITSTTGRSLMVAGSHPPGIEAALRMCRAMPDHYRGAVAAGQDGMYTLAPEAEAAVDPSDRERITRRAVRLSGRFFGGAHERR